MQIVVSPYHLTTRESPAMAALLLARRVVTLLPAPLDGARDASSAFAAAARVPTYKAFMKSWAWTMPLWNNGIITGHIRGDSPASDMFDIGQKIASEAALSPLRAFTHEQLYEDERSYLGALAADLLKGGPDPGISVPVAAGLDRFASRHGMTVARSMATSIAQRAEVALATTSVSMVIPMLVQATAERLLHAREILADVLEDLWDAVDESANGREPVPELKAVAFAYQDRREEILEDARNDEVRAIEGAATLTWLTLPGDAVLRSSLTAAAALGPRRDRAVANASSLPVVYDPLDSTPFSAMVVKPLGVSSR